jgi:hypothetical protein
MAEAIRGGVLDLAVSPPPGELSLADLPLQGEVKKSTP